ncbi:hypothetical protein KFK09_015342 [Dendrobium nobile]|uniref:Pectinesterase n=1 Tax=Dendrobium nobile TaxID=94219 RepID=A0A8T3B4I8_DENNO|nr:hypothetical protein KFK09_015342 [Dendrobium nobile]
MPANAIDGYYGTLYVHSFRQFYRDCDVCGTVDFIFGNAGVLCQGCNLIAKKPMPTQTTSSPCSPVTRGRDLAVVVAIEDVE